MLCRHVLIYLYFGIRQQFDSWSEKLREIEELKRFLPTNEEFDKLRGTMVSYGEQFKNTIGQFEIGEF